MDKPYRPDRDRDRDRHRDTYRDRDNHRDRGDRDFHHQPRRPSRFSDGPAPPPSDHRRSPGNFSRGGLPPNRRGFESPPRQPRGDFPGGPPPTEEFWPIRGGGSRSNVGGGDYRPLPGGGSRNDVDYQRSFPGGGPRNDVVAGEYRPVPGGGPRGDVDYPRPVPGGGSLRDGDYPHPVPGGGPRSDGNYPHPVPGGGSRRDGDYPHPVPGGGPRSDGNYPHPVPGGGSRRDGDYPHPVPGGGPRSDGDYPHPVPGGGSRRDGDYQRPFPSGGPRKDEDYLPVPGGGPRKDGDYSCPFPGAPPRKDGDYPHPFPGSGPRQDGDYPRLFPVGGPPINGDHQRVFPGGGLPTERAFPGGGPPIDGDRKRVFPGGGPPIDGDHHRAFPAGGPPIDGDLHRAFPGGGPPNDGDFRPVPSSGPRSDRDYHHPVLGGGSRSDGDYYHPVPGGGPPPPLPRPQIQHPPPPPSQHQPPPPPQLSGQKRGFPFSGQGDSSPVSESYDGTNFVKLFVGSVPRTATEQEIRPMFEEQGNVLEVALIKDKRTGQQQGCCFIKFATSEEADRAIRALHNQYTLPGGVGPVQVRYADGERERLGNVEYKLFVGALNKFSTEKEVEEIFAPYGRIEDVYLMRDEKKLSRGCGFVKFSNKDSAMTAINSLNGIFTMRGCDQPLTVRFADPKRPRPGESRAGPAFGGPGFGSPTPGIRPTSGPSFSDTAGVQGPANAWQPMSPQNVGPSPNTGIHGLSNQIPLRSGEARGGHIGSQGSAGGGSLMGSVSVSSTSPQNFKQPSPQVPFTGQQISPMQKPHQPPQQFPPSIQLNQGPGSYSQTATSQTSMRPFNPPRNDAHAPYGQSFSSQQLQSSPGQFPVAQFQVQQAAPSAVTQLQPSNASSLNNSQLPSPAPQPLPYQQCPSQLTQMLSQQTQSLQATFQSSQQAFSQLQQQLQILQPSTQNQPPQQRLQASKQQAQWTGAIPTAATSGPLATTPDAPSTSSAPFGTPIAKVAPVKCNWTEHTSPDGYKYYYNSATGQSSWNKPEELALHEQQQQKVPIQLPQAQPSLPSFPIQQDSQSQPQSQPQFHNNQPQPQIHNNQHLQYNQFSSMYPAPRGPGNQVAQEKIYTQPPGTVNSVNDPARFQQGIATGQDWAWKGNSGGR